MSFDIVETFMGTTDCGKYPEFTCSGFKCRVKWSVIRCDLPQTRKKRVRISLDVPETRWDTTHFSMDIPEISMHKQEWTFKLPDKVTVETLDEQVAEIKLKGDALKSESEAVVQAMQKEVTERTSSMLTCRRQDLLSKRSGVASQFDAAIAQFDTSIQMITAQGGNPRAVINDQKVSVDMLAAKDELVRNKERSMAEFDAALKSLDDASTKSLQAVAG